MERKFGRLFVTIKPVLNNKLVKDYSYFLFSLITSVFFAVFAIQPTVNTIVSLQKSINEQQEVLNRLNKKVDSLSQAKTNYTALKESTKNNLFTLIPETPYLPILVSKLSSLASQNQASTSGIQFESTPLNTAPSILTKTAEIKEVGFTMNVIGDYQNLLKILEALGKFSRLIEISTITFTKALDNPLTMSINGRVYFIKN